MLQQSEKERLQENFSKKDLAVLYENSFDSDGNIICLAMQVKDQLKFFTEVLTLIFCIRDEQLREVALCNFIKTNDLYEILLEASDA